MSEFDEPAFPISGHTEGEYSATRRYGLTIRQQAVLMAPTDEITAMLPSTVDQLCKMVGITAEEYKADEIGAKLRVIADLRCRWADTVLRLERETRDE